MGGSSNHLFGCIKRWKVFIMILKLIITKYIIIFNRYYLVGNSHGKIARIDIRKGMYMVLVVSVNSAAYNACNLKITCICLKLLKIST